MVPLFTLFAGLVVGATIGWLLRRDLTQRCQVEIDDHDGTRTCLERALCPEHDASVITAIWHNNGRLRQLAEQYAPRQAAR